MKKSKGIPSFWWYNWWIYISIGFIFWHHFWIFLGSKILNIWTSSKQMFGLYKSSFDDKIILIFRESKNFSSLLWKYELSKFDDIAHSYTSVKENDLFDQNLMTKMKIPSYQSLLCIKVIRFTLKMFFSK